MMTECQKQKLYQQLERLLQLMTDLNGFSRESLESVLAEICIMFRISKGMVRFYQGLNYEMQDRGESYICYDNGRGGAEVHQVRIVTSINAVVKCSILMPEDEEPLSPDEFEKVDLVMKTVLNFVSRKRLQNVVEMLAFHDESGFYNSRYFQRCLHQLNEKNALGGKAAIHFNLRHFTLVNQEIGKTAGDLVIRNYYDGLSALIGQSGIVCRLGGDNFVAICDQSQLDRVISYLKGTPVPYDAGFASRIKVSASAGIYSIPEGFHMHNPGEIMDKIIFSSQAARSGGTEYIRFFSDSMITDKERVMRVQQRFPAALQKEEFQVHYQPKIDLQTGALAGAEALCRWFRGGETILPAEFIPVLESTTDICKLDFYMLEHVCRDLRQWLDEGRDVVRISVNLSRRHMMDIDLLNTIIEIIDRYNVPHQYIEIELTETTTDVEFKDLKRVVGGLQKAGIYTSVDDFGVGYSSLNLIREIPWNVVKIDRSFLPGEQDHEDSSRSIMFRHVISMAKELGLACIAEGVETQSQVDILRDSRCGLAQGFFFDRVLCKADFEEKLCGYRYPVK